MLTIKTNKLKKKANSNFVIKQDMKWIFAIIVKSKGLVLRM